MPNEQLEMWSGYRIKHVPFSMKASKLEPDKQPAKEYEPDTEIVGVFRGTVDAKVTYERTEAGWVRSQSITVSEFYEDDAAEALLADGHARVAEALQRRMGVDEVTITAESMRVGASA